MADILANIQSLKQVIRRCAMCPRQCHVDRTAGQVGDCRIGHQAVVASAGPHFGEEPVFVGRGGSGTIFFSGCNLDCVFCQNFDISHCAEGRTATPGQIAKIALSLQRRGCVNINFVTPTHVAHAMAEAIMIARAGGLTVPIVYNCGGYESVPTLQWLDGLIDIYMPDFKWADDAAGRKYSGVPNYPTIAAAALAEMFRQVGPLRTDDHDAATRGVLIRHLVMPGDLARSRQVIDIVARTAPGCAINVMEQYHPAFRASEFQELSGRPDAACVKSLRDYAKTKGLRLVH
jgi:putative pyruvate formate lyase activating enzyme